MHNILILKHLLNTIRPIKQNVHHLENFFIVFKKWKVYKEESREK